MHILASALLTSLGQGKQMHLNAMKKQKTGLSDQSEFHRLIPGIITFLGEVSGVESIDLPEHLQRYTCRNNQLAWQAMQVDGFAKQVARVVKQVGEHRVGLVVGTSTSGIAETEAAFKAPVKASGFQYHTTHQMGSLAQFCCEALQLSGPAFVVSTACSSSAKVFSVAKRWLDAGLVDAVVVGGVDSICLSTLYGFYSLGLVSESLCKPLDENRNGINIGEAGGFLLLSNHAISGVQSMMGVQVVGIGESSDAHHISTPHPEGEGAHQAMLGALRQAGLSVQDIHYLNLHGTATPSNDLSELSAVARFLAQVDNQADDLISTDKARLWISSTKGFTGHTLGAAGITEIIFCQWALEEQVVLPNLHLQNLDKKIAEKMQSSSAQFPREFIALSEQNKGVLNYAMSNSFGFGGNNACVILKAGEAK